MVRTLDFILSSWQFLSKGIAQSDLHHTRITLAAVRNRMRAEAEGPMEGRLLQVPGGEDTGLHVVGATAMEISR